MALKPENAEGSEISAASTATTSVEGEDDDDPFMQELVKRYDQGKRWLATIMGEDPDNFTEKDIQRAIKYLMPSGLYAKDARPVLLHPRKLYPKRKADMFDSTGRPISAAFYTGQVAYYDLVYEIYQQTDKLDAVTEETSARLQQLGQTGTLESQGSAGGQEPRVMRWARKEELESKWQENVSDKQYEVLLFRLKKLANHPKAHIIQDFLNTYRYPVSMPGLKKVMKKLDEQGRASAMGHRKRAIAEVWVKEGAGQITVNDRPFLDYFTRPGDRQQILFPFLVIDKVGEYDVECNVIGGGPTGQAGAIRLAVSRALLSFSESFAEPLKNAGLLIRDPRIVERKKPGQKKARKKFAWVKR